MNVPGAWAWPDVWFVPSAVAATFTASASVSAARGRKPTASGKKSEPEEIVFPEIECPGVITPEEQTAAIRAAIDAGEIDAAWGWLREA